MVVRGDSELGALLTLLVLFGGFVGLLTSAVLVVSRKFRIAAKLVLTTAVVVGVYVAAVVAIAFLTPQRIIDVGESYCMDIWCIGIEKVNATPRGNEILYKVDVRI